MDGRYAPEGKLWVCCACGKTSTDLYGDHNNPVVERVEISPGWDESCILNARLFPVGALVYDGARVVKVNASKGGCA